MHDGARSASSADPVTGAGAPAHVRRLATLAQDDPQLRALMPDPAVEAALATPHLSFAEAVATVLAGYGERPALGRREYDVVRDPATGREAREHRARFATISYAELRRRVEALANAWTRLDEWRIDPGEMVCVVGFAGIDYVTVDLACLYAQGVAVPLQGAMGRPALDRVFADTAPAVVAATSGDLVLAAESVATQPSVRTLVVLDHDGRVSDDRENHERAQAELTRAGSSARLVLLADLVAAGDPHPWEPLPVSPQGAERVAMLMHSSGTTGTPKGAIMLERHARSSFKAAPNALPRVRLSFTPMNHTMGRGTVYGAIAHGGTAYFVAKPDLSTLFEDLQLVRPTDGFFFPRALEMIYRHYQSRLARRTAEADADRDTVRAEILGEMRESLLGGRLCLIKGGSAPTAPEVRAFVVDGLGIPFRERYGSTEAGSITVNDRVRRPHVKDYRLRDAPELGYLTSDSPFPRGELCVKTGATISGYFKRPDATAELFDADGFVCTGDIVEERGPDHIVYVDRRNDVLKLAQGEFVAAGALGTTFEDGSEVIHQIYVYGNSTRAYLLAVVVPNLELLRLKLGHEPDQAELRELIRAELKRVASTAGLRPFEIPRDFIVETEPFSQANGLLTGLRKRVRPAMQRKYGARLEQLYADLERKQTANLAALHGGAGDLSVIDRIGSALRATLGLDDVDVGQPHGFTELGGDSLGAAQFARLLEDVFDVAVPIHVILSPAGNVASWARWIEGRQGDGARRAASFADVHGEGAPELDSRDLDLAAFLDPSVLEAPSAPPTPVTRTVLLTGATGFLGRFLCLEWLERLAAEGGRLLCLVRATDHAAAARRLASIFRSAGPELEERFEALAQDHLTVIAGDVAEPALGLTAAEYARLASDVDRVVHAAALVNHVLDYEDLFASNVAGTAQLVGLALTERRKAFDFVSSGAVFRLLDRAAGDDEDAPLLDRVALERGYADGYRTSKWAAEHLLQAAGRRFGLPVNVFRGDMMLPHRSVPGQINEDDMFSRLLFSVIATGVAPASFYLPAPDGTRAQAHYDGLPVDFAAAAIAGISARPGDGVRVFNVVNHHADDGLSLDVFVDWIVEAGYEVERIEDYDEWLACFTERLHALPDAQRRRSSEAILDSLRHPSKAAKAVATSRRFDAALRTLGGGFEIPHLDREYILKCVDDLSGAESAQRVDRSDELVT